MNEAARGYDSGEEANEPLPPLPDPAPPPQFHLRSLFLVTTTIALVLATGQFLGWRNLVWILAILFNPFTFGSFLDYLAERSNRQRQAATRALLDKLRRIE
jgi:hypothetical protein